MRGEIDSLIFRGANCGELVDVSTTTASDIAGSRKYDAAKIRFLRQGSEGATHGDPHRLRHRVPFCHADDCNRRDVTISFNIDRAA